ncbi:MULTISPECIES: Smr/MutS family protein [Flavobacteriaceae]|uniref:Smr/MutS family protein n=1 Tax=Flavobacteriaceae TaxID=49546 RepID=UPI0010AE7F82|nr:MULTISPECIES: Smr/MutS family protein [Flavobacteriaceae]NJB37602.1 DNA mismatch repair protein MutS [Croceivirga sp. JEA036]TKD62431.1 DNA mismatch repair protein MutS [Flavobacterium sp. ASW18X]
MFKKGDSVEVLDEPIKGNVIAINNNQITIETEDGFPLTFSAKQLVKVAGEIKVSNFEAFQVQKQKDRPQKKRKPVVKPKERNAPKMEVDLHIHQLTKSVRDLTNFDMLNLQLDTAKRQLEFAINKRIQKVVFIHGVGEGVLKEELHYLFGRYSNVSYYDADYKKYGLGATEVYISQNG